MFTEWLKYTYLVNISGSTIHHRQYENYQANRQYGVRQEISESYEQKTLKMIEDMQAKHK